MSLPALDTPVILRIPDREALPGTVTYTGQGWLDVELSDSPRTPLSVLERHWVFLEYVDPAGLVRIMGQVGVSPMAPGVVPPVLRVTHREVVQLLRRREHAGGVVHAAAHLVRADDDSLAHATQTVAVSADEFAVRELPGAGEGEVYEFTIWPGGNEPPVSGTARVTRVAGEGHVVLEYVLVAAFERERLGRLLIAGGERSR
jgi:hypothetical protein